MYQIHTIYVVKMTNYLITKKLWKQPFLSYYHTLHLFYISTTIKCTC